MSHVRQSDRTGGTGLKKNIFINLNYYPRNGCTWVDRRQKFLKK